MRRSRRYIENAGKVDREKHYSIAEALQVLKSFRPCKYDETVEVVMKLGVDPKKAEQAIRGSVSLPKGLGKTVRVVVFADGALAEEAKKAGAIEAGGEDLAKKVEGGWMEFDVAIAHPTMMSRVGKLGRILGPKGLMPSPKSGTVTPDVVKVLKEFAAGKVEYRTDTGGNVHAPVGKVGFKAEDLEENIRAFTEHIRASRPATTKGTFVEQVYLSTSMGPGVLLETA
ncbi:MAG: 50S ribosomal protein L1 [Planctomycetota bacterium]